MAATGKTPILLYGSTTATNTPSAGNLTNSSDGCEIAINVADKNLFFKDSTNVVNTVPIRQSSASSNGWLSSTDWSTFNNKQPAGTYVTSVTGTAPVVSSGGTTPAISMAAANGSTNGYLTSTDWNTFNGKAPAFTYTSNYIPYGQGTTTPTQSSAFQFSGSTLTVQSAINVTGSNFSSQSFYGSSVNTSGVYTGLDSGGGYVVNVRDAGYFAVSTNNTERWRTFSSGGVSIGNTTDPGATNLSVTGAIKIGTKQAVNGPAFGGYASGAQTLTNGTIAKIAINTEEFDTNSNFDPTTNYRFTPTVEGYYQINGAVTTAASLTGITLCYLFKNGSAFKNGNLGTNSSSNASSVVSSVVYMNGSTDYMELYAIQNTGGNLNTVAGQNQTYFNASMVRGA